MHHLLLITALSTTTGIFGGKHCGKQHHGKRAVVTSGYSSMYYGSPYAMPQAVPAPSYRMAPATPGMMAPPAPPTVPAAPPSSGTVAPGAPPVIGTE